MNSVVELAHNIHFKAVRLALRSIDNTGDAGSRVIGHYLLVSPVDVEKSAVQGYTTIKKGIFHTKFIVDGSFLIVLETRLVVEQGSGKTAGLVTAAYAEVYIIEFIKTILKTTAWRQVYLIPFAVIILDHGQAGLLPEIPDIILTKVGRSVKFIRFLVIPDAKAAKNLPVFVKVVGCVAKCCYRPGILLSSQIQSGMVAFRRPGEEW